MPCNLAPLSRDRLLTTGGLLATLLVTLATTLGAAVGVAAAPPAGPPFEASNETTWILGARLVDVALGDSSQLVDVVLHGDRIVAVLHSELLEPPSGATQIEGGGLWLAPGAFDSHTHVSSTPGLLANDTPELQAIEAAYQQQIGRSYLQHGFTQIVDLNHFDESSIAWFGKNGPAPDLLHVGTGLTMAGGYPLNWVTDEEQWSYSNFLLDPTAADLSDLPEGIDPAEHTPEAAIGRVVAAGGVGVKVFWEKGFGGFTNLPTPSRTMLDQILSVAHDRDLPVVVHANSLEAWDFVTQSSIDGLVHGLWNWGRHRGADGLPGEISQIVDRAIAKDIALMPTTRVIGGLRDLFDPAFLDDPRLARVYPPVHLEWLRAGGGSGLREGMRQEDFGGSPDDAMIRRTMEGLRNPGDRVLQAFVARGGNLVFGSDTPSGPFYTNPPGLNGRLELEHLATLGIDPLVTARALTLGPAKFFGVSRDYGEVAVGRKANLLLLRSDPLTSIEAWGDIKGVFVGGQMFAPEDLQANR